jgi:hypothetical protein
MTSFVPIEKVVKKYCCSACGVRGHNKNNKKFHPVAPVCLPVTKQESDDDYDYVGFWTNDGVGGRKFLAYNKKYSSATSVYKEIMLKQTKDEEEDDVCYGKHCDKKSCLKLATGWNRLWGGVADKRFEVNLYCDDCFEQDCFEKCEACCVVYPMTSLNYRTGGLFGEHCGNNLYCEACCKDIEKRMTLPDEDELV